MKKHNKFVRAVLDYVLDSELDDFVNNVGESHVYFKAFAAWYGLKAAKLMLKETVEVSNEVA